MARPGEDMPDLAKVHRFAAVGVPLGAVLLMGLSWVGSRSHMVLAFSPAEVHFLFQGPIARRTLLDYKLLRAQAAILPLSVLFTLLFHPLSGLSWPLVGLGLWTIMVTFHLHQVAAGLVRASWTHHGRAGLRRQWLPMAFLAAVALILGFAVGPVLLRLGNMSSALDFFDRLESALARPAPALVLLPFRIVMAPLLAMDAGAWAKGLLGAAGVAALHYLWVMRIDSAFEETAASAGQELQSLTTAFREGRGFAAARALRAGRVSRPWFRLRPDGRPAVALFWKSFTAFTRNVSRGGPVMLIVVFVGFRVLLGFISDTPREAALGGGVLPLIMAGAFLFIGPLFLRNDLRTGLQRQELMRTFPLVGRDVVAAEVLASGASVAVTVMFFLTISAALFAASPAALPHLWMLPVGWLGGLVVGVPLCVLAAAVQNALAIVFPSWAKLGPMQGQGMDQMGAMILLMLVTGVLFLVGLLVPVLVGGTVAYRLFALLGPWTALPAAVAAWLALVAETIIVVVLLGETYDELDVSEAGLLS